MKLSAILLPHEYTSLYDASAIEVKAVETRIDRTRPGVLFICLRGTQYDTHVLLERAAENGAAAAVVEEGAEYRVREGFPVFTVTSSRRAFAYACYRLAGCPGREMYLIAVTGTNGKTSTAAMIAHILRSAGKPTATIGTLGARTDQKSYPLPAGEEERSRMTTPDPDILYPLLRELENDGITHVVLEASSHALALEKLSPLRFAVGVFTNLSPEHLDYHGTMSAYLSAKAKLFSMCDAAILNLDSDAGEEIARRAGCPVLRCGAVYHEEYNAEDIRLPHAHGVSYIFRTPVSRTPISVPIPGVFTVYNSLLALTCAYHLGISPEVAGAALRSIGGVPGRLERIPLPADADFSVFIDYAHTEAALRNLLLTVRGFRRAEERIVLLFGCGGDRDKSKRAPMGRVAEELADFVIVTSDNSRFEEPTCIIHDILRGMHRKEKRRVILDRRRAITYAIETAQRGDILLLVGKGHETYELAEGKEAPLCEKEIVLSALDARRKKENYAN